MPLFFTLHSNYCILVFYNEASESFVLLVLQTTQICISSLKTKALRTGHGSLERKAMFFITLDVDSPIPQIWRLYLDPEYKLDIIDCKLFHIYMCR